MAGQKTADNQTALWIIGVIAVLGVLYLTLRWKPMRAVEAYPMIECETGRCTPDYPQVRLPYRVHVGDHPEVLYQNTEELEVVRGENGRIEKIVRHIKVTKND
jgi:hypothetical protein